MTKDPAIHDADSEICNMEEVACPHCRYRTKVLSHFPDDSKHICRKCGGFFIMGWEPVWEHFVKKG